MAIDDLYGAIIGNADMVWLDSHNITLVQVQFMDTPNGVARISSPKCPYIGKLSREKRGYSTEVPVSHKVGNDTREDKQQKADHNGSG
jgi:hypothetical protein